MKISAFPHSFPLTSAFDTTNTALLVIDMQTDFCAKDGYIDRMGLDLTPLRAPIEPISRVLKAMRERGFLIAHTRETFEPDLSDVQPHRLYRGERDDGIVPGDKGPMGRSLIKGEPCWDIIPELAPHTGERIFDKHAYGAFGCTEIDAYLREQGIKNLVLTGVTTDCCIQSNLREALDRGYECLVLEDCCGASRQETHERAIALMKHSYAVFGCLSQSASLLESLTHKQ